LLIFCNFHKEDQRNEIGYNVVEKGTDKALKLNKMLKTNYM